MNDTSEKNGTGAAAIKKFETKDIPQDSYFTKPVYLNEKFILAAPEMPFTQDMKKILEEWEIKEIFSTGKLSSSYAAGAESSQGEEEVNNASGDGDNLSKANDFYDNFSKYVDRIFTKVVLGSELEFSIIAKDMKSVCEFIREERRFLLRVQKDVATDSGENYITPHSVKSTIISIIIGSYLKLPNHKLIELGVAAMLHDVGMLKLPSRIYLSKDPLGSKDQETIATHPILGYNMLKSFDFPLTVTLAALEHHERENGSGYPRKISGERISLYSKIIAVACSYEALSSQRPYKEAKDGYTGMVELLKNESKQYDDAAIRALVFSLSIYPIGLYVLLSSGQKGQVVDVNPENPRYPMVQVFGEINPDGKNKVFETSKDGLAIVRPLTRGEIKKG